MKLRAISLSNVRRFIDPVRVDGIGDGLNVLCEPNEQGKSTLFDAVQALFFAAHSSQARDVKALRPHAGGAPEVTVEVETDAGRFEIAKRWLSKPSASVTRAGRLIAQADAAEAWIAELLGGGASGVGGPSGLVWVRQGMTGLAEGSNREKEAALAARRDLMSSVGHEVEAMTSGRSMDRALARCREELARLATSRGAKVGGPWKAAIDRAAALEEAEAQLAATARDLHAALDSRRRVRRELAEIEAPEAAVERAARLAAAEEAQAAAARHAERIEAETRKVEAARLAVSAAQTRLETWRAATAEHRAAQDEAARRGAEAATARTARQAADAAFDAARAALDAATERHAEAEAARRAAATARAARDGAERRRELADRIGAAEAQRRTMEQAAAAARTGPDARTLRALEAGAADLTAVRAARDAEATQVAMHYAPGAAGSVTLDGAPLEDGRPVAVRRTLRLDLGDLGALEIRPADAGGEDSAESAGRRLRAALDAAGAETLDAARNAAAARAEAERRHGEARAVLASLAPEGLEALREALARIPVIEDDAGAPDPEAAEADLRAADAARIERAVSREAAAERASEARAQAARAETGAEAAVDRRARASAALERLGETGEEALAAAFAEARARLESAEALLAEAARSAPDLAAAEAALTRAKSVVAKAADRTGQLRQEAARLEERISGGAGDAVEERLAETGEALAAARADLARIEHEVAVLRRLETALGAAKAEALDRYFAPVAAELKPLLRLLWPDAALTWGQDTLLPEVLVRDGIEEPVEILSDGTQEQVALLVRLAFARMLSQAGRHAPVILDDALVFSDDDRIERMFDALHRQAGDLQILVLTCRQRAFRALGGHALRLVPEGASDAV